MSTIESNRPQPLDLSQEQINQLREGFNIIDKDNNGHLDVKELGSFMARSQFQQELAPLAIKLVDSDHDNKISFDEFLKFLEMVNELRSNPNSLYTRLFNLIDVNKNGTLEAPEVKEFLGFFSKAEISNEQVRQFISRSDTDGDGRLTFTEIMHILGL